MTPAQPQPEDGFSRDAPAEHGSRSARRLSTVERAFELARSGDCRSLEEIAAQLKSERLDSVDAHLAGSSIRKALRQLCAEGRSLRARRAEAAAAPEASLLGRLS